MTDKNLTEIVAIVDRSGSMDSVQDDAIGGFNTFLAEQQKSKHGKCLMTYVQFDGQSIDTVHECKPIHEVPKLTRETFQPRGSTPLYDAIGTTIQVVGQRLSNIPEEKRPGNVVIVILTDGQENASREFHQGQIQKMVKEQTDKYDWTFIYLAQNIDAFASGRDIGMHVNSSKHFMGQMRGGGQGAAAAYYVASAGVNNMRYKSSRGKKAMFSAADKDEMTKGVLSEEAFELSSTDDEDDLSELSLSHSSNSSSK